MLEIEIKLNPYGSDLGKEAIGKILIANIGKWEDKSLPLTHSSTKHNYYNYVYVLSDGCIGVVKRHDRSEDIFALLARCMNPSSKVHLENCNANERKTILSLLERLNPVI